MFISVSHISAVFYFLVEYVLKAFVDLFFQYLSYFSFAITVHDNMVYCINDGYFIFYSAGHIHISIHNPADIVVTGNFSSSTLLCRFSIYFISSFLIFFHASRLYFKAGKQPVSNNLSFISGVYPNFTQLLFNDKRTQDWTEF